MFGDRRMELDPKDLAYISRDVDLKWYSFWTFLLVISAGWFLIWVLFTFAYFFYAPTELFIMGIAFLGIGLAASFGSLIMKNVKVPKKLDKYDEKTKILFTATEKKISSYLRTNIGNAYSKQAILTRLQDQVTHPYYKKYIKNNGERILNNMVSSGLVQTAWKGGKIHYFITKE